MFFWVGKYTVFVLFSRIAIAFVQARDQDHLLNREPEEQLHKCNITQFPSEIDTLATERVIL